MGKIFSIEELNRLSSNDRINEIIDICTDKISDYTADFFASLIISETNDFCKWYEINALGTFKQSNYINIFINILKKPDVNFDYTSLHLITSSCLADIGENAYESVVELLDKKYSIETRRSAVDTLGEMKLSKSVPILIDALGEEEFQVALWAGLSLAKIGVPSVNALIEKYNSIHKDRQPIIIDALMQIDDKKAIDFVVSEIGNDIEFINALKNSPTRAYHVFLELLRKNNLTKEFEKFGGLL